MADVTCPYCNHGQEVCHDDGDAYEEGVQHEQWCAKCNKAFGFYTTISFDYSEAKKIPCLNGEPHKWTTERFTTLRDYYPDLKHCEWCGKEDRGDRYIEEPWKKEQPK